MCSSDLLMEASRANGAAVVVVTHDPNVAAFCDRTITMQDGRLADLPGAAGGHDERVVSAPSWQGRTPAAGTEVAR